MSGLDVVLLLVVVAYAISGFVQGFVTNAVSTVGLLSGGLLGIVIVPVVLGGRAPSVATSVLALVVVLVCAVLGQAAGSYVGGSVRDAVTWRPLRSLDSLGGSLLGMAAVLVIAWGLGYAVSGSQIPVLSKAVRDSQVLRAVDGAMPDRAQEVLRSFDDVIDTNLFPRYIEPFQPERIKQVEPPDEATLESAGVVAARDSVVKIVGDAVCQRSIEGSGFAYGPDRVMTNAHVVAGVERPTVVVDENRRLSADVVVFDPELDVAVLAVDGLGLRPLAFDTGGDRGDAAAVLGYPENGPFDARAARIRDKQRLRSPDIYGAGEAVREAFAVRSLVRSGNSGGPLVSADGEVYGVVFAASVSDSSTGYAVTAAQVAADARRGLAASQPVGTGGCTR
jgi:S1-C subfamily serine protease